MISWCARICWDLAPIQIWMGISDINISGDHEMSLLGLRAVPLQRVRFSRSTYPDDQLVHYWNLAHDSIDVAAHTMGRG